jgi:hypothetical protein
MDRTVGVDVVDLQPALVLPEVQHDGVRLPVGGVQGAPVEPADPLHDGTDQLLFRDI